MTTTTLAPRTAAGRRARDVLGLFKLRIGVLIMITALVGMAVTAGPSTGALRAIVLALSVLVASAAAGAFNQYVEHDADRLMKRTRTRAFVTGALPHTPTWLVLIGAMLALAVAAAWWVGGPAPAAFVFLGAFFYGVVYTVWLKRRSWTNIVVGGLAGSFAVLAGAAAVDATLGLPALLLAAVLFLWTPPHFWSLAIANRADYEAAGVPMLPVVAGDARAARVVWWNTVALVAISLVAPVVGAAGLVYAVGAAAGGAYFLRKAWLLAQAPSRKTAMASFFASLVQLSVVLIAATIDVFVR